MFLIVLNFLLIYQYFKKVFLLCLTIMGCLPHNFWFDLINEGNIFQQRKNEMLLFLMFQRVDCD